jgi:UDP-glucuronate 4-epimerase
MKILVTGAAGFVGSRLSQVLLARGDAVVGVDNFDPYYDRSHKDRHLRDLKGHENFAFHTLDLRSADAVRALVQTEKPDAIAHLAALAAVRYSARFPLGYGEVNVQGSLHLLEAARHLETPPLCVLASTGSVYGRDTPVPFSEDAPAVSPLAPYPASKRAMEMFAHSFAHLYGLPVTILRFFNVYGPQGRPDMMPWQWAHKISRGETITLFDGGRLKRDWTFIDDIVAGFVSALAHPFAFEILNLGCGRPVENRRFVQVLEELIGKPALVEDVPSPASEPFETFADISKARRMLGYEPQVNVEEGLARFVGWMREEGEI